MCSQGIRAYWNFIEKSIFNLTAIVRFSRSYFRLAHFQRHDELTASNFSFSWRSLVRNPCQLHYAMEEKNQLIPFDPRRFRLPACRRICFDSSGIRGRFVESNPEYVRTSERTKLTRASTSTKLLLHF